MPSRCNLFTGRYSHCHQNRQNNAWLAKHEVHLFKALKQTGYYLGYIEKNHLLAKEEFVNFDFKDLEEDRSRGGERAEYMRFWKQRLDRLGTVGSWASSVFHDYDPKLTEHLPLPAKRDPLSPRGPQGPALLPLRVVQRSARAAPGPGQVQRGLSVGQDPRARGAPGRAGPEGTSVQDQATGPRIASSHRRGQTAVLGRLLCDDLLD